MVLVDWLCDCLFDVMCFDVLWCVLCWLFNVNGKIDCWIVGEVFVCVFGDMLVVYDVFVLVGEWYVILFVCWE